MVNDESKLLLNALLYEEGHPRRTQHILKVYALSKLIGEYEKLSNEEMEILKAAAILHDIAIKYCKENYDGDACQQNQKKVIPKLVLEFLKDSNYNNEYIPIITNLVERHHEYENISDKLLQVLIEADLIVNSYENSLSIDEKSKFKEIFKTSAGKKIFEKC